MPLFDIEVFPFMIVPSFVMMGIEAETQEEAENIALNYYLEEAKRVKPVKTIKKYLDPKMMEKENGN